MSSIKHARLSPSASSRWLRCPASVKFIESLDLTSKFNSSAKRGTMIHHIAEEILKGNSFEKGQSVHYGGASVIEGYADSDMIDEANFYVEYIRNICNKDKNSEIQIEAIIDLSDIYPVKQEIMHGYSDAVIIENSNLHIVDLKTGANIVEAENNSQLMLYAYGSYLEHSVFNEIDNIVLHIVQNNKSTGGDRTNSWSITPEDLIKWIEDVVKPASRCALVDDDDNFVVGEVQCKWCPAVAYCEEANKKASQTVVDLFDEIDEVKKENGELSIQSITKFLADYKLIETLVKGYEDRLYNELLKGKSIEGYKLVTATKHKKWVDEIEAYNKLSSWCKLDDIAPRKLITPTQAEKQLGTMSVKKRNIFDSLWVRPEGQLTLALASDKRPAQKVEIIEEDFDILM